MRAGKKNWWLWAFHHGADCCFIIRASRGKDVVADLLGEVRPTFWVSDRSFCFSISPSPGQRLLLLLGQLLRDRQGSSA